MGRAAPHPPPLLLLLLLLGLERSQGAELTFELPDNAKQCFHEQVEQGVRFSLDYQVITGGHYDVDCYVEDPLGNTIYRETKKQYDSFTHRAEVKGVYQFCFSNEFSTFSHKTVYFDFQVGDEPPILPDMGNRVTALTQMESACVTIHEALKTVIESQTHYRLREAQDRARAEDLRSRVSCWSVGETILLFVVSASQVLLLRSLSFEPDARPRPPLPCVPGAGREVSRRVGGAAVGGQEGGTGSPRCPSLWGTAPRCLGCLVCVCSDDAGPPRAPSVPEAALQSSPPHCDGAVSPACRAERRPGAPASCVSLAVGFWRIKTQRGCPCQLCVSGRGILANKDSAGKYCRADVYRPLHSQSSLARVVPDGPRSRHWDQLPLSGSTWVLTCKEPGWFTKDSDKHLGRLAIVL